MRGAAPLATLAAGRYTRRLDRSRRGRPPRFQSTPMTARTAHAALDCATLSHPGMVRSHNEDSVFVDGDAGIAILADGMGGYNAGEVASGIAVNVVSNGMLPDLRSGRELSKIDVASGLTHAALLLQQQIAAANKGIYEAAQARPECAGMGTTHRGRRVLRQPRQHRPHRRFALLPAARREVRAADARPLAAAGADRQRPADARSRRSTRSTRTWSRARSASRRSFRPTSSSTASRRTTSTCSTPTA